MKEFEQMQENLKQILLKNESKIAFTLDGWSFKKNKSFYGITCHFINNEWNLISTALDFKPSNGNHAGLDIAKIFYEVISHFELSEKIGGIVLDNVSANSTFVAEFGKILRDKNIDFEVNDQHFRCLAHIINLAVQDVLKLMGIGVKVSKINDLESQEDDHDEEDEFSFESDEETSEDNEIAGIVNKIRKLLIKIRNSESLTNKLKSCSTVYEQKFKKPVIDSKIRWNTTHDMLEYSHEMRQPLDALCDFHLKSLKLTSEEWEFVEKIVDFLRDFKIVSEKISGESYVTLPDAVTAFNQLLDKMENESFELDNKEYRNDVDEQLILAFQKGRDKLLKHYRKMNWIYCISLLLDLRIKSNGLNATSWGRELKGETIKKFKFLYKSYYQKFSSPNASFEPPRKKKKILQKKALSLLTFYLLQ